jgi:hypothetical protein
LSASLVGHILHRNWLIKPVIEEKLEGMKRRARRRKQLLDDLKEKTRYWNLKEEKLDRTLWKDAINLPQDRLRSR